jgi:hypothetical protein
MAPIRQAARTVALNAQVWVWQNLAPLSRFNRPVLFTVV